MSLEPGDPPEAGLLALNRLEEGKKAIKHACVYWPCGVLASQAMSGDERAAPTHMQRWPGEGGVAAIREARPKRVTM